MRAGFRLASGDPEPSSPPPALGADTDRILAELGYAAARDRGLREAEGDMNAAIRQSRAACERGLVGDLDHRDAARHDPLPRLPDRGADRPDQLPGDDLADAARRAAERGPGRAARHRADGGGRPRAAGAVDRHRAHGGDLRRRHQQRHGLGDQRAGRRARRRRRAGGRALPGDRRPCGCRRAARRRRRGRAARRWPRAASSTCPGFGHRFHPDRPARAAPARAGRRRRRPPAWSTGRFATHRPGASRTRSARRKGGKPHPDEHRRRHRP